MFLLDLGPLVGATIASTCLTYLVIRYSRAFGAIDVPNERSSHRVPTPRGGGLAIVIVVLIGTLVLTATTQVSAWASAALIMTGLMVAAVGYADDKFQLRASPRLAVHVMAAIVLVAILTIEADVHWFAAILYILGITWSVNLFNFMDGIDGIAGSQAVFVTGAAAILASLAGGSSIVGLLALTCGACLGFLVWNWSPARIFMGDVGSGFLGFWVAALSLVLHTEGALSIWTCIVLNGLFVADATTTLVRRMMLGKRWYEAHRSHAYQHLATRWGSHGRVTLLVWIVNLLLILPLAMVTVQVAHMAPVIAMGAIVLLGGIAWRCGAGAD